MTNGFKPATRKQARLRLALTGLAGGGKTWTSLAIAKHLVENSRVAVIDTERGSASLYADKYSFDVLELAKHSPADYIEAIELAASSGYDVIVIDSLSHAWIDSLDAVDRLIARGDGNNFTAWRKVSPAHNRLVDAILSCPAHMIATMRSKVEYAMQESDRGKKEVKKLGLAPVQRSGVDYEFTIVGDLDLEHRMLISKSRIDAIPPGEILERPGEAFAKRLRAWLDSGIPIPDAAGASPSPVPAAHVGTVAERLDETFALYLAQIDAAASLDDLVRAATGPAKPDKGTPNHTLAQERYRRRKAELSANGAGS